MQGPGAVQGQQEEGTLVLGEQLAEKEKQEGPVNAERMQ